MQADHWMTFGSFQEQQFFTYPSKNTYDGILFNGNMVAHAPGGLASFLLEKTKPKIPYLIDPVTHAFQHDPRHIRKKDGDVKSSIRTLAEHYGEIFTSIAGLKSLQPNDLDTEAKREDFVFKCLSFQKDILSTRMHASPTNQKYLDHKVEELHPCGLIAPYFFLKEYTYTNWLELNIDLLKISKRIGSEFKLPVYGAIVIDRGLLTSDNRREIEDAYLSQEIDGIVIWVDGLDEELATGIELRGLLKLAEAFRQKCKFVLNSHGGYFSTMFSGVAAEGKYFSAVSHGPEYGESRAVVPVGGGIPISKYYVPLLHSRVKYRDAVYFFNKLGYLSDAINFHLNVCNCEECKDTIDDDPANFSLFGASDSKMVKRGRNASVVAMEFPTREAKLRCLKHYLQRKRSEFIFVSRATRSELMSDLDRGLDEYGEDNAAYLARWKSIVASLMQI